LVTDWKLPDRLGTLKGLGYGFTTLNRINGA
jgi:hypothetical protein